MSNRYAPSVTIFVIIINNLPRNWRCTSYISFHGFSLSFMYHVFQCMSFLDIPGFNSQSIWLSHEEKTPLVAYTLGFCMRFWMRIYRYGYLSTTGMWHAFNFVKSTQETKIYIFYVSLNIFISEVSCPSIKVESFNSNYGLIPSALKSDIFCRCIFVFVKFPHYCAHVPEN